MSRASHNLPGVLGEIADLVGIDPAVKIAEAVGGTSVYLNRRPEANQWLTRVVGLEIAAEIVDHFTGGRGGINLVVPIGPAGSYNQERAKRAKTLAELTSKGLPSSTVAREARVTQRAVQMFNERQRRKAEEGQGELDL